MNAPFKAVDEAATSFVRRHIGPSPRDIDAMLEAVGAKSLTGVLQVGSIEVKDENLKGHLGSPDFFDLERYPEIRFESTELDILDGGELVLSGNLTIKGTCVVESYRKIPCVSS